MLISAQAALNKAKTSELVETWDTEAEIVCIVNDDDSACRSCLLWDEASEQFLGSFNDNTVWSEFQDPHYWSDLVEEGDVNVQVETRTQYWGLDDEDNEKAYMYCSDLQEWFVRGVLHDDEVEAISWYTKPSSDIPDWVWEASGLDKEEHENVIGDDGSRAPSYCATGCPDYFIGDGYCDQACQNEDCDFDAEDCGSNVDDDEDDRGDEGECAPGCPDYFIGDNYCDEACETEECDYDGGDCPHDEEDDRDDEEDREGHDEEDRECSPGCPDWWIGDNWCDGPCDTEECDFDGGDCGHDEEHGECAPGCPDEWIGDDWCDHACHNDSCDWDGGDCRRGRAFLEKNARKSFLQKRQPALIERKERN